MKTRLLIIIGLLIVAVSTVSLSLVYNQEIKLATGMMKSDEKSEPQQIIVDPLCFVTDTATSGESGGTTSLEKCYPLSDLENLGCDKPILSHLARYSNLLDEEFGTYMIDLIGLPDGVSQEKFEKCVDVIFEKRLPSSTDYAFSKLNKTNACTDEPSICYGTFENNTSMKIQCDFVTHGCGPVSFDRNDHDVTDEDEK